MEYPFKARFVLFFILNDIKINFFECYLLLLSRDVFANTDGYATTFRTIPVSVFGVTKITDTFV